MTNDYKNWDLQIITYTYDKVTRKLRYIPSWSHWRYYISKEKALSAIGDIRHHRSKVIKVGYMGPTFESKYLMFSRFRIVFRDLHPAESLIDLYYGGER